jgi:hypothetical protein
MKTLEESIECLEARLCPTKSVASNFLVCPECGRRSLEAVVSYEGEAGYRCRCGFGCIAEELDECYADDIEYAEAIEP